MHAYQLSATTRAYTNFNIITTLLNNTQHMKQAAPRRVTGRERERGCGQQWGMVAGCVAALTDVCFVCDGGGWWFQQRLEGVQVQVFSGWGEEKSWTYGRRHASYVHSVGEIVRRDSFGEIGGVHEDQYCCAEEETIDAVRERQKQIHMKISPSAKTYCKIRKSKIAESEKRA